MFRGGEGSGGGGGRLISRLRTCVISFVDENDNLSHHLVSPYPACGELFNVTNKKIHSRFS